MALWGKCTELRVQCTSKVPKRRFFKKRNVLAFALDNNAIWIVDERLPLTSKNGENLIQYVVLSYPYDPTSLCLLLSPAALYRRDQCSVPAAPHRQ